MKRVLLAALLLSSFSAAQTADEIINKAIAARGGMDKIKSVQTLHMEGTISFGGDDQGKLIAEWKRPGKFRQELVMNGKTVIRMTNGREAWSLNQLAGETTPKQLPAKETEVLSEQADFDKPLFNYKAKGYTVELIGKEPVEGKDTYKLKLTLKNGSVRYESIDANSFLETKWNGKIENGDKVIEFSTYFRDYRTVNGVQFPFILDTDTVGSGAKQKIVFDTIEVNSALSDARFEKPPAEAVPAPK